MLLLAMQLGAMQDEVKRGDYINRYLPQDSLIRQSWNQEREHWLQRGPLKNDRLIECEYINKILAEHDQKRERVDRNIVNSIGGVLQMVTYTGNRARMKSAVHVVLADQPNEVRSAELKKVSTAADTITTHCRQERVQRLQEQEEARQRCEKKT